MFSRVVAFYCCLTLTLADGPADNRVDNVRPVPPPGVPIPDETRAELESGVAQLLREISGLHASTNATTLAFLPDVEVYGNAVDYALRYNEIYDARKDVAEARELLRLGRQRAEALTIGKPAWTNETGLMVFGYTSRIDRSVQPYGLVVPRSVASDASRARRLDAWFHGRGEKLTELNFISGRLKSPGEFVPPDAFVLHLYGRYCNANKFAGEIDLLEALDDVKRRYAVDEDRIVIRGFSMGGAACWQFAVHYPGMWAAAAPGAGFSETKEFLRVFQNEPVAPPPWEKKLWHWYDCPDYAVNLFNLPTVAYSGEIDKQKQAADIMATALRAEGIELTHIIGPKTAHKYHPDSREEINRRIDSLAARGRDPLPRKVKFATFTLRYNRSHWVILDRLEQHWERARIDAEIVGNSVRATTTNIAAVTFEMPPGRGPFEGAPLIEIDGQRLTGPPIFSDRSWRAHLHKAGGHWQVASLPVTEVLAKAPGLQGPIDDAFMDSFVMVFPTGDGMNEAVAEWVTAEKAHATNHWRKQFRGEARVVNDTDLSEEDIKDSNLVLWGDPESNAVLANIAARLPISWDKESLTVGDKIYPSANHVPVLIFPNPLNPKRYVVLNSGFTFREYDYLNNARQIAKLPDFAILDISVPPNARYPGKVAHAGFFDEEWRLKR
jgi:hypothetical protein